jgi:molybdopterin-guanine dinucleotide biosynthesis protein A
MAKINGFVLAGGKSTRMGQDKASLNWRGRSLLEHMVTLLSSSADHVRVVGRPPLPDRIPDCGPLGGIVTALDSSDTEGNLVVAVDLPLLTPRFLFYLRLSFENSPHRVLACKLGSHYPLCLAIRRSILPELEERLQIDRSVHGFLDHFQADIITENDLREAGFDARMFLNVNSNDDLDDALGGMHP